MTDHDADTTKLDDFIPKKDHIDFRDKINLHIDIPTYTDNEEYSKEIPPEPNFENIYTFGTVCESLPRNSEYTGITLENSRVLQDSRHFQFNEVHENLRDHETRLNALEDTVTKNIMLKFEVEQKNREIEILKNQVSYLMKLYLRGDRRIQEVRTEFHIKMETEMPIVRHVYDFLKNMEVERKSNNQNSTTEENARKFNSTNFYL